MADNPLQANHLWIVALAATVALLAVFVLRPSPIGPGSSNAELEALSTGEMAAFEWRPAPVKIPQFTFQDAAGNDVTIDNFSGKVVLLNLWATWCAPCLHEMPTLDRLQGELGSSDFQVVALALDAKGAAAAKETLNKLKIANLDLYIDASAKATRPLKVIGMPTTIILDRDGRELGRLQGPATWDSAQAKRLIRAVLAIHISKSD